mgnify:CR=1 FL=1
MSQKKPSGGQTGNQNARTHGFYSKAVKPEDRKKLRVAADMKGLDQEIALLRSKISNFSEDPEYYRLILPGIALLSRLLLARQKLGYDKQEGLLEAVGNVLRDIVLPPGMTIGEITRNRARKNPEIGAFPPDLPPSGNNESCSI